MTVRDSAAVGMLTVSEAAKAMGVAEATMRFWVLHKRITYAKVGKLVRIPASEIDRILAESMVPAQQPIQLTPRPARRRR